MEARLVLTHILKWKFLSKSIDVHSGYLILALLGFQFLDFRLKPFVDPMPVGQIDP